MKRLTLLDVFHYIGLIFQILCVGLVLYALFLIYPHIFYWLLYIILGIVIVGSLCIAMDEIRFSRLNKAIEQKDIEDIIKCLVSKDYEVSQKAYNYLRENKEISFEPLKEMLKNDGIELRKRIVPLLGYTYGQQANKFIAPACQDSDAEVRKLAKLIIGEFLIENPERLPETCLRKIEIFPDISFSCFGLVETLDSSCRYTIDSSWEERTRLIDNSDTRYKGIAELIKRGLGAASPYSTYQKEQKGGTENTELENLEIEIVDQLITEIGISGLLEMV